MPIKKVTAFVASDDSVHATVQSVQQRELEIVYARAYGAETESKVADGNVWATVVMSHADAILDILTTGPRSRPATRKQKGTGNPKRAAKAATPEQAKAGLQQAREAVEAA